MTSDTRELARNTVALLAMLVIGILVGRYGCAPPAETRIEKVVERVVEPAQTKIVYECPPVAPEEPRKPTRKSKQRGKRLPDAAAPTDPLERKRLLAWVRDQSSDLEGCRTGGKGVHRMMVRLVLNKAGQVTRVHLNAGPGELPAGVQRCLQARMAQWVPPKDLVEARDELFFGLTL